MSMLLAIFCFLFVVSPVAAQPQVLEDLNKEICLNPQVGRYSDSSILVSWNFDVQVIAYRVYFKNLDTGECCCRNASSLWFMLFFDQFKPCNTYEVTVCAEGGTPRGDRVWTCETVSYQVPCVA